MSASASEDLSRTFVLNALRDICDGPEVLDDEGSRAIVREAFEAAVSEADRERFRSELSAAREFPDEELVEEVQQFFLGCASDVVDELVDRGTHVTLIHRAPLSVPAREAAVYSFMVSEDPAVLDDLSVPDAVRERLDAGAAAFAAGDFDEAVDAFDAAISESAGGDGAIAARVLAGAACHRGGRDEAAIDYVEETLHLEMDVWTAKLVGYAADHRFPDKFRNGKLGARVFFRWSTDFDGVEDVAVALGPDDDAVEPTPLDGGMECMPVDRLWPDSVVQLEVSGVLPSVPAVQTYYVATGVADLEVFEARTVEELLLSGPATADATERLRFE